MRINIECPNCSQIISSESKFCSNCGTKLAEPTLADTLEKVNEKFRDGTYGVWSVHSDYHDYGNYQGTIEDIVSYLGDTLNVLHFEQFKPRIKKITSKSVEAICDEREQTSVLTSFDVSFDIDRLTPSETKAYWNHVITNPHVSITHINSNGKVKILYTK